MIKELKKIIKSEINKDKKKSLYSQVVDRDTSKIVYVSVGKLSY